MTSKNVTPNSNYWLCNCPGTAGVHTVFEMSCPVCQVLSVNRPRAEQWLINQQAQEIQERMLQVKDQPAARRGTAHLPEQRKKPWPTRQQYESALEERARIHIINHYQDPWRGHPDYAHFQHLTLIIKRYKHACATGQSLS